MVVDHLFKEKDFGVSSLYSNTDLIKYKIWFDCDFDNLLYVCTYDNFATRKCNKIVTKKLGNNIINGFLFFDENLDSKNHRMVCPEIISEFYSRLNFNFAQDSFSKKKDLAFLVEKYFKYVKDSKKMLYKDKKSLNDFLKYF